ncbi:MAG TPA: phosphoribosylamine--glycine ligase [Gaiellaceae bacterium]|nr:phosphoribosylamine--glycine ligase [Gaiellaceae bacterium]
MDVLIVGGGGREHALAWKLAQSPGLGALHAAPGNPGIARLGTCHGVRAGDTEALVALGRRLGVDLVVVGPEAPLVAGLADDLREAGIAAFGPSAAAARIEGSKSFAKEVLEAAGVPTAVELDEPRAPCVVKADGLAAGKGVFVCETEAELAAALPRARALGDRVVVEELLEGREVSLFALCDGERALTLAPAQDFKRLLEGNLGPNTGGMGSYSPVPWVDDDEAQALTETIHVPVLRELNARGAPFQGLLYAGLMLTESGPRVLEFNCRFGDPETQAILPRLEGDVLEALAAVAGGSLAGIDLTAGPETAVTLVLAAAGYPDAPETGVPIDGIEAAEATGALVFHAGTAPGAGGLVTGGGRVLNVTALGDSVGEARERAYRAAERIELAGVQYRRDIALGAVHANV